MADWLDAHFWWVDFAVAAVVLASVVGLRLSGRISRFTWRLFWLGAAIGLCWEVPLSTLDGLGVVDVFDFLSPPPLHFGFIIVSHTLWDGGLFLAGVALVYRLSPAPRFGRFSARELAVLLVWGQLQEVTIELLATGTAGWTYVPAWWNPALFTFRGHFITLVPQLMWLAGVIVFYACALRLHRSAFDAPA